MSEPVWLPRSVVEAIHREQIAEHGGADGIRAPALLEQALARGANLLTYSQPDTFDIAAAYAQGIGKQNPIVDGNKRTDFLAADLFLRAKGRVLHAPRTAAVRAVLALAYGSLDKRGSGRRLRENSATK